MLRNVLRLAVTSIAIAAANAGVAQQGPASVGVETVMQETLSETVPVFAEVVTARNGAVASRVAGNIDSIFVMEGNTVERGDILVELNRDLLSIRVRQARAQISEAEASVATAKVRLDSARISFNRVDALRGSASFSEGRFDDVQSAVDLAQAQLSEANARRESANAQLAEAEYQLERSTIRAPFAGVVLEVQTVPGAVIQAGTPVVTLLDTGSFEIEARVPARYVVNLSEDRPLTGTLETGATLTLQLRAILPVEDPSTRTRAVRFSAPALAGTPNIAQGQSLTVDVPIGAARDVVSVPKDALVQSQGGWTVFVVEDGKAQPRNVVIGVASGNRYEVVSGLEPGDVVVVRGNERLRPGQDIAPTPQGVN